MRLAMEKINHMGRWRIEGKEKKRHRKNKHKKGRNKEGRGGSHQRVLLARRGERKKKKTIPAFVWEHCHRGELLGRTV
jgi:hypothetical protein